jgi:hypothetical protein
VRKKTLESSNKLEVIIVGNVLATYPSGSNPAKEYNIIQGKDGVTYCDCMGWKMNKHCKHLKDYLSKPGRQGVKTAKKDPEPRLSTTIDRIVEEIRSGG